MAQSPKATQKARNKEAAPIAPARRPLWGRIGSNRPAFVLGLVSMVGLTVAAYFLARELLALRDMPLVALGGFVLSAIVLIFAIAWLTGGLRLAIHPAFLLASLDLIGLGIASLLSYEELRPKGQVPCPASGPLSGCHAVAESIYSRPFFNIPVAVYGVALSITLFTLAIAWWRTGNYKLLLAHYGLSLVGVMFEGWFQFAQVFLIKNVCIWCESYGISLVLRFVVALWVYLRTPNPASLVAEESS
jgi:uncharacterized membrane protein